VSRPITPVPAPRDFQQSKVSRAENLASQIFFGQLNSGTRLRQDEVVELINDIITHPNVIARWGAKQVTVLFVPKSKSDLMGSAMRSNGRIVLSPEGCTPFIVVHEVAHLLATKKTEAFHGPGFCAILHYLFVHILGESAGRILLGTFAACSVKIDHGQIPAVRAGSRGHSKWDIPGIVVGEAQIAAKVIKSAMASGLFNEDQELKKAAQRIARKLDVAESYIPKDRMKSPSIPSAIRIDIEALGDHERDSFMASIFEILKDTKSGRKLKPKKVKIEYGILKAHEQSNDWRSKKRTKKTTRKSGSRG
jgi:hypothetical protein